PEEDKKPLDKKPIDKKPEEKKPDDKKPTDKKPDDKKPLDKKPEDKKLEDKKPEEKKEDKKPVGTASISGHVTFQGKPLIDGTIVFTSEDGKAEGKIAQDGTYKVEGVKPGKYRVGIKGTKIVAIPARYKDAETSALVCEIQDGKQEGDFDLN